MVLYTMSRKTGALLEAAAVEFDGGGAFHKDVVLDQVVASTAEEDGALHLVEDIAEDFRATDAVVVQMPMEPMPTPPVSWMKCGGCRCRGRCNPARCRSRQRRPSPGRCGESVGELDEVVVARCKRIRAEGGWWWMRLLRRAPPRPRSGPPALSTWTTAPGGRSRSARRSVRPGPASGGPRRPGTPPSPVSKMSQLGTAVASAARCRR